MAKVRSKVRKPDPAVSVDTKDVVGNSGVEVGTCESTGESPASEIRLIPQKHGGSLLSAGQKGLPGGPGRTPDQLRGTIRQIIDDHGLPFLKAALSATGTIPCPECGHEIEVPKGDPKLMAKLLDTGLRASVGTHVEIEHQGVIVVIDPESLSV